MANGIFKANNGTYYVSTTFTTKDNFHIKKCKRGFKTIKQAMLWKIEQTDHYANSYYSDFTQGNAGIYNLIGTYVEYKAKRVKPSSAYFIEKNLKRALEHYKVSARELTPKTLEHIYKSIVENGNNNNSINVIISYLMGFFEWLQLMEYIDIKTLNKAKIIFQSVTHKESKNNFLDIKEFKRLVSTFKEEEQAESTFIKLLYFSGLRKAEAYGLRFCDIQNSVIHVDKQAKPTPATSILLNTKFKAYLYTATKTNQTKDVFIPEWLENDIKALKGNLKDNDYIFPNLFRYSQVNQYLKDKLKEANLKEITIHDLRHSHTTLLYEMGVDAKYVAERLGHSSELTSLKTYEHLTRDKKQSNDNVIASLSLDSIK